MKKLLYILALSNLLLLGSEQGRVYTKNTCYRTSWSDRWSSDKNREECALSRLEVYDPGTKQYVAHVAYDPAACDITYLLVDEEYRKKGIGAELTNKAIEDMRTHHNCREISVISVRGAEKFWEKLGAEPRRSRHVFPDSSSNLS